MLNTLNDLKLQEYIDNRGLYCPVCAGKEVGCHRPIQEADVVMVDNFCDSCGAEWVENYEVVSVDIIQDGV